MIRGAAFDIDGTLLDSTGVWDGLGVRYLASRGVQAEPGLEKRLFALTLDEGVAYLREHYGLAQSAGQVRRGISAVLEGFYRKEVRLKPGAGSLVRALRDAGVRMVLTTAGDPVLGRAALARLGIWDCFERLLSCDVLATTKAEPTIYRMAADALGLAPREVLVVEDTLQALRCAHEAGFPTCAVEDEASVADRPAIRGLADAYLRDFTGADKVMEGLGENR